MRHRTTIFRNAEGAAAGAPAIAAGAAPAGGAAGAGSGAAPAAAAAPGVGGDALAGFLGGIAPDVRSLIETKGWHKDATNPGQIVERLAQGYTGLEKAVGADKIALPPAGADGKRDWLKGGESVFKALGRPDTAEGYKFTPAEGKEFTPAQVATQKQLAAAAHKFGLADWQVQGMGAEIAAIAAGAETQSVEQVNAESDKAEATLKGKWGEGYDGKKKHIDDLAQRLGAETMDKITKAGLGRDVPFLELLERVGEMTKPDDTTNRMNGGAGGGGGSMPQAQAAADAAAILGDPKQLAVLQDKFHPESKALNEKLNRLYAMAIPEPQQ